MVRVSYESDGVTINANRGALRRLEEGGREGHASREALTESRGPYIKQGALT